MPAERAGAVRAFAQAYLRRLSGEVQGPDDQLAREVLAAFEFLERRGRDDALVRAVNPTLAQEGYEPPGSVVETNTDDLPFLVDSVTAELEARGLEVERLLHPIVGTERDADGRLLDVRGARAVGRRESLMHFEVDRRLAEEELPELENAVLGVLSGVRRIVDDFPAMSERVDRMLALARSGMHRYPSDDVVEAVSFLHWLREENFTFLGYREYEFSQTTIQAVPGSGLGILADASASAVAEARSIESLRPEVRARVLGGDLLLVTKTNRLSPVHRRARMDYIGVLQVDRDGRIVGGARLLGLFTGRAYAAPAAETPVLNRKLRRILDAEELIDGTHDYKAAVSLFESFPKDELFAAPAEDLRRAVVALLGLPHWRVRMLRRRHADGRGASLIVALPQQRATPELIERLTQLFAERYGTGRVDSTLVLGEGGQARVHYSVHAEAGAPDVAAGELEREVVALARTWEERLRVALSARHDAARARELANRWAPRLGPAYKAAIEPEAAVHDVGCLARLEAGSEPFVVGLRQALVEDGPRTRLALYQRGARADLSAVVPVLEALGLRVVEELPWALTAPGGEEVEVHDFGVLRSDGRPLDLDACAGRLADCLDAVWRGRAESDSLNRLVVTAGLDWPQVAVLRAYRSYRQRVGSRFGPGYERDAFAAHPEIGARLVRYFERRFDPAEPRDGGEEEALRAEILERLDGVASLDEDRILRDQLTLIDATLRTNAFKPGRGALAIKLRSGDVPGMPRPAPLVETFVHSPEMEGIHLRGGLVARGGIRFSDRMDFRTEVFGLMRAQMTKNALIVPTGAKGGFVLKRRPPDPAELGAELERRYRAYVQALLDVTDDRVDGRLVHPEGVRVLDGDDPYLVVAPDKGTATLSDTANALAAERGFWLGDAFASGGSTGYDHKALGITARGAWESVKRHFRELGTDVEQQPFTVVGIGDMSGDVFGNGMLLSDRIRLVAAYDHRHVFIDPDPDPDSGFAERRRLFELAGSSWDDYDRAKLSPGGGVWPRTAKGVPLSPQARAALGTDAERLTPDELIRAILRAPADLLFNGGIGTVVKASTEPHAAARDRGSDAIRVDARELRCRVVVEGGNLGLTQQARIEFAAAGGRVHTDFIDNSAGVDCSDHEVNLKVLLGLAARRGELDGAGRGELLRAVTGDVTAHVLADSYRQARLISLEVETSRSRMSVYEELIARLEDEGAIHREADGLPSREELADRRRAERGMLRPEVAVLLAHAKRFLTDSLLRSDVPDDASLETELRRYFPPAVVERFGHLLPEHPLKRELVATLVSNDLVNSLGLAFAFRLEAELAATLPDVVRAYRRARDVTGAPARWAAIEAAAPGLERDVELELLLGVDGLVDAATRWYLRRPQGAEPAAGAAADRTGFECLEAAAADARDGEAAERLREAGVPAALADAQALLPDLLHAPQVVDVAARTGRGVEDAGRAFELLDDRLRIGWLAGEVGRLPAARRMQRWAAQALRDDVLAAWRTLAERALEEGSGAAPDEAVERFLAGREDRRARLADLERALTGDDAGEMEGLLLAVRLLEALAR
ncbi:MAG: NAD-glutamate dehydrogenase domain-containing protein [Thermoleophilaceae bacterium]